METVTLNQEEKIIRIDWRSQIGGAVHQATFSTLTREGLLDLTEEKMDHGSGAPFTLTIVSQPHACSYIQWVLYLDEQTCCDTNY